MNLLLIEGIRNINFDNYDEIWSTKYFKNGKLTTIGNVNSKILLKEKEVLLK